MYTDGSVNSDSVISNKQTPASRLHTVSTHTIASAFRQPSLRNNSPESDVSPAHPLRSFRLRKYSRPPNRSRQSIHIIIHPPTATMRIQLFPGCTFGGDNRDAFYQCLCNNIPKILKITGNN